MSPRTLILQPIDYSIFLHKIKSWTLEDPQIKTPGLAGCLIGMEAYRFFFLLPPFFFADFFAAFFFLAIL